MTSQSIGIHEICWFSPEINPPPFETKLLLMVAGSRSDDCGGTFEVYTDVFTGLVQTTGPGDEYDDKTAHEEYISGDKTDFLDFQFYLQAENGDESDFYSDSIVAWAYYPLEVAKTAINVERDRLRRRNA